mgnify:CR=1 FL=1
MPYPPARPIVLHLHHFTKSLTLRLVIISFVAAWLARDTAPASSVHSLQEMTMQMKDNMHPLVHL